MRERLRDVFKRAAAVVETMRTTYSADYSSEPAMLRLVSALAEGADQIAAQEALACGWDLQAPLPFAIDEYARDFHTTRTREDLQTLLSSDRLTAIVELDGDRKKEPAAYEAVGRMVLRQSDALIAIWDGAPAAGIGGTPQIVQEAVDAGTPVVWIDARRPHAICMLARSAEGTTIAQPLEWLDAAIRERLAPPPSKKGLEGPEYFRERQRRWSIGFAYAAFCDLVMFKMPRMRIVIPEFIASTLAEWQRVWPVEPPGVKEAEELEAAFVRHYAWADKLADYYANLYRSSFTFNYLMAGAAVAFALIPYGLGWQDFARERIFIALELFVISAIIAITVWGSLARWHDRWIGYRFLAEQLRHLIFLAPLGRTTPAFRIPAYAAHDDPRNTWVSWHFRAIVREAGMLSFRMDARSLEWYRKLLMGELSDQVNYHARVADRSRLIGRRLQRLTTALFILTAVVVLFHLFGPLAGTSAEPWATVLSAVIPAFGAALAGIAGQAEFHRIVKRSGALKESLGGLADALARGDESPPRSEFLGQKAELMAQVMTDEVLDWRTVVRERPLTLPT